MDINVIYIISGGVSGILSILLNAILVILIFKSTNNEMKAYCHVLLQNCLVDTMVAVVQLTCLVQFETTDTQIFVRTATPWFPKNGIYPCLASWLYVSALFTMIWSMFIQALFRYCMIVRKITLSRSKTWLLQLAVFIAALINTLPYLTQPCSNVDLRQNLPIATMDLWDHYPNIISEFRGQNMFGIYFIIFVLVLSCLTMLSVVIFAVTTLRVRATMNSAKCHFSPQTLRAHKQFGKRMILQSIPPFISMVAISIVLVLMFAMPSSFTLRTGGLILCGIIPMQYINVFNPLITLFSIKSYRRVISCRKLSGDTSTSNLKSTVGKLSTITPTKQTLVV